MKKILFALTTLLLLAACNSSSQKKESDQSADEQTTEEQAADEQPSDEPEPQPEAPTLTYADVAGMYDSFNEDGGNEYRITLLDDGTATWNVIGSLHWTDYTYTIQGNTICLKVTDVDTEEEYYDYDPVKRTLSNEQGAIYYYQDVKH